jgi:hypothetical protein
MPSSQKREATTNAFSVLMGTKKIKKRSSAGSHFVLCPLGCGRHIPENGVNLHLDKCIQEKDAVEERKKAAQTLPIIEQVAFAVTQDMTPEKGNEPAVKDSADLPEDKNVNSERKKDAQPITEQVAVTQAMTPEKTNEQAAKEAIGAPGDVLCPAGCGRHIPENGVNLHLDKCIQEKQAVEEEREKATQPAMEQVAVTQDMTPKKSIDSVAKDSPDAQDDENAISTSSPSGVKTSTDSDGTDQDETATGANDAPDDENANSELKKAAQLIIEKGLVTQDMTPKKTKEPTAKDTPGAAGDKIIHSASSPSGLKTSIDNGGDGKTTSDMNDTPCITCVEETSKPDEQKQVTPEATDRATGPNIFAHMMQQSKLISAQKKTLKQSFCLCGNGTLLLTFEGRSIPPDLEGVQWSSGVHVRDRHHRGASEAVTAPRRQVELSICSYIPSHIATAAPVRLVRQHSRLSVPVLKSILQKCIRRRRPLPAVRVAMELIDKSLGDLLRRLPVIILEDSSMHPDFGILVWLMIAYSKDYALPPQLIIRVLQIIFEVASCQWSDPLVRPSQEEGQDDGEPQGTGASLSSFHEASESVPKSAEEMIWSILVRAEYGGMKGDIRMLHTYADLWKRRFSSGSTPGAVASQLRDSNTEAATSSSDVEWCSVPMLMHRRAKEQGESRVSSLCATGIDQLRMEDICIEGVDFHCSAVVDHLLLDNELVGVCQDLLVLSQQRDAGQIPATAEGRRSWLEGIFKECIWNFSAGVNRRHPLISNTADGKAAENADPPAYSNMWSELMSPRVRAFQQKYVQDRLARCKNESGRTQETPSQPQVPALSRSV